MNDNCPNCGRTIQRKTGSYKYKESGLDNVHLENIPVYECSCGISYASIFRASRLNELIAETLLEKPALLSGKEIKFLRKSLYLSSKAFSASLGVEKTTASKWENEAQHHSEAFDRLIRATYMIIKGIRGRKQIAMVNLLKNMRLGADYHYEIIAEKVGNDYVIKRRLLPETQAQELPNVWVGAEEPPQVTTPGLGILSNLAKIEGHQIFSYAEILKTSTDSYALMSC